MNPPEINIPKATENADLKNKVDFIIQLMAGVQVVDAIGFVTMIISVTVMFMQISDSHKTTPNITIETSSLTPLVNQ